MPLLLKDVYHKFYAEACLRDLLSEGPIARAGGVFTEDATEMLHKCLKICGIAARVVPQSESNEQERERFRKLVQELESRSCVRIDDLLISSCLLIYISDPLTSLVDGAFRVRF